MANQGAPEVTLTLGDIYNSLTSLREQGAHPGSIFYVLKHKVECYCGNCDLCDTTRHLVGLRKARERLEEHQEAEGEVREILRKETLSKNIFRARYAKRLLTRVDEALRGTTTQP